MKLSQLLKTLGIISWVVLCLSAAVHGQYITPDKLDDEIKPIIQNSFAGGINNRDFPSELGDNQAVEIRNAIIEDVGVLKKRGGIAVIGDDQGGTACLGLGKYTHSTAGTNYLTCFNTVVYKLNAPETAWTSLATGFTTDLPMYFEVAGNFMFMMNGTDRIRYYDASADTVTTFGSSATDPPLGKIGVFLKERMFIVDEESPSNLRYSDTGDALEFTAANLIPINKNDGQRIMALVAFKNDLLVFKEGSIWALDMTGSDPVTDWVVSLIDNNFGTLSTRTVKQLGNDVVFLDQFGQVRSLIRTKLDTLEAGAKPFSDSIRDTMDLLNRAQIGLAAAEIWEDTYVLAFPSNDNLYNDKLVVWNNRQKSWAEYTGWHGAMFDRFTLSNIDFLVMGMSNTDSLVYKCYSGTSDERAVGATDAIDFLTITKEYTADFIGEKQWQLLDILCKATGDGFLTVEASFDSATYQSVGSVELGGDGPVLPVDIPFILGGEAIARGKFHLNIFDKSRGIQFRFRNNVADQDVQFRQLALFARITPYWKE